MKALRRIAARLAGIGALPLALGAAGIAVLVAVLALTGGGGGEGGKDREEGRDPAAALTPEQAELYGRYDDATASALAALTGQTWGSAQESAYIEFTDCGWTERSAGTETEVSFACAGVRTEEVSDQGGKFAAYTYSCLGADGGYFFIEADFALDGDGERTGEAALKSDAFAVSKAYKRVDAALSVEVTGLPDDALPWFGGDRGAVEDAVSAYCALNYPVATEAVCTGRVTVDYTAGTATTSLTLNTASKIPVTLTSELDTGELSVKR